MRDSLFGSRSSDSVLGVLLLVLVASTSSCNIAQHVTQQFNDATAAVERFHQRLDSEQYAAIYLDTDDAFRKVTSEKEFTQLLSAIHRKLGATQSKQSAGWNVTTTSTSVVYRTKFAEGEATEQFRWRMDNGKAWLLSYNINSNALIVK
jgi:hypothetical protein